ncbi:MAG TPA: thiolase family protein [Nitrososphaeraceae archaeon]|nr:thiolase family protein [Nitrososphaeraceae archaeon]
MLNVAVCSYATSKFSKSSNLSIFDLACQPCIKVIRNSNISKNEIDGVLFSSCSAEQYGSNIICETLGISPKISHRIESLCNSGTNAIVSAYAYISSGLCDSVLVVGAEKASSPGSVLSWDVSRGSFTLPVFWAALFAKAHMRKYGTTEEQMGSITVRNRSNALKNPEALFGSTDSKLITLNDVMQSRRIADPIKLLDCSCACDGSSAVLLLSEDKAKKAKIETPVWIKGIGQQIEGASFNQASSDLTSISASRIAARQAYTMSNTSPRYVDIAELHDSFTILQILALEDLGFIGEGMGGVFFDRDQSVAINPRGGILGCGHPIGTTGVAQLAEIAAQLSGKAGQRQVKGCKTALVHNLAAAGTSSTVMILGT